MKKVIIGIGILVVAIIAIYSINNNTKIKGQKQEINTYSKKLNYTCLGEMKNGISKPYPCSLEEFKKQDTKIKIPNKASQEETKNSNERREKVLKELKQKELNFKNLSIDDQYYKLKKPKLDLISNQDLVDYENKRILIDRNSEIPRFEDPIVDERMNFIYKNYDYEKNPEEYNGQVPEPIKIVNYRFFQYLKPIDVKRMIGDTQMGLIDGFDFYWLENGNDLKEIPLKKCGINRICYYEKEYSNQYSLHLDCNVDHCRGRMSYNSRYLYIHINKRGELFMYNQYDKEGGHRAETIDPRPEHPPKKINFK